jgi:cytochrome P450
VNAVTLAALNDNEMTMIIVAMAVGGGITVLSLIFNAARSMQRTREVEQSRRELAAYVAEGSMSPEDAERIMKSSPPEPRGSGCGS